MENLFALKKKKGLGNAFSDTISKGDINAIHEAVRKRKTFLRKYCYHVIVRRPSAKCKQQSFSSSPSKMKVVVCFRTAVPNTKLLLLFLARHYSCILLGIRFLKKRGWFEIEPKEPKEHFRSGAGLFWFLHKREAT